jgi:hypothetical protein
MAGAFDRETLSFSTTDEQVRAAGSRAAAIDAAAQAKTQADYTKTKSTTGKTLLDQQTTIKNLAARANEIADPNKRKAFIASSKAALGDVKLGLELQAIIDKAEEASNIAKDPNDLMRSDSIFTSSGKTGVSNTGKYYLDGVQVSQQDYVNQVGGTDRVVGGGTLGGGTGGDQNPTGQSGGAGNLLANPEYAALIASLESYGLKNIASVLERIRVDNPSISGEGMLTLLRSDARYNKEYLVRFSGNEKLKNAGKPMLDERTYLANEAAYEKVFTQYQLPQFVNRSKYADYIGGSIAPTEIASRVSLAYDRVLKANPGSLDAFRRFFPQLSTGDIVGAMLDPAEQLPALQRKVIAAELGGAAIEQGLNASLAAASIKNTRYANLQSGTVGAETLQQAGVDKETAQVGYEKIAMELPTMEKLSSIYGTTLEAYTQKEAEQSQLLGLASATRKKQQLLAREAAQFQGTAGTTKGSFSTQYLSRQSSTGAF